MNPELLGYIAGVCTASALLPQVYKSWKTKSTKDISILWNLILIVGLIFWVLYGYYINGTPIIVFAGIEAVLTFSMLFLKLKYK